MQSLDATISDLQTVGKFRRYLVRAVLSRIHSPMVHSYPTWGNQQVATLRRDLTFDCLNDSVNECRRLLESGYIKNGNWTLAQICEHLRLTIEASIVGYPTWMTVIGYPLRPLLRTLMMPRLLAGKSPSGVKTAGMFIPQATLDDQSEVDKFSNCVDQFLGHTGKLHSHPGFGRMNHQEFSAFHAAHAAHHLSFLGAGGV